MNEDPIIPGGVLKAALVVLAAAALGVGSFAIAGDGIDIDLPDLPDLDTTGDGATNLESTNLEQTTIDGSEPAPEALADPYTSAGFSQALTSVRETVGPGAQLTRLFINEVQTQFILRKGADGIEAYSVRADSGEVTRDEATITISGDAEIDDFAFALDGVDAGSVDRMLAAARKQSGTSDFRPTVLSLERAIPFGSRELEWTINAHSGGRNLLYRAKADGSEVRNEGGEGTAIPPAAIEAQKLNHCIQQAGSDPDEILACLDRFE